MKYDVQDCFHVSAAEAETWKRAVATPPEAVMMATVPQQPQNKKPLFGSLFSRND
ncbi:MAG TPA: hypothetical protein PLW48_08605 [Alphaproteobacteria bacterium]|nr:hypothetical protein [Alphaproteobacteria bacterium]HRI76355.1 hypothetical protein [Alphaproteobacteria bacterium]HRJ67183.1 hypothetical protein [Alphaproteobacteria bacterium]